MIPDVSFMTLDRVDEATMATSFYRAIPLIELLSSGPSDERIHVGEKMTKYMDYGVDLGWVVDPFNRSVTVYPRKPGKGYEVCSCVSSFKLTRLLRSKFSTTRPQYLVTTSSQGFEMEMASAWEQIDGSQKI